MKELLGKIVSIKIDDKIVKCLFLKDCKDHVVVQGKDGRKFYLMKHRITSLTDPKITKEKKREINLTVIGCENSKINCPGVLFCKRGKIVANSDFNVFMSKCPLMNNQCLEKNLGDLGQVDEEILIKMLDKTIFGTYPKGK